MTGIQVPVSLPPRTKINIFVGNLSQETTESKLTLAFSHFGPVTSARIINDTRRGTKQPKVYAYIGMAEKKDGEAAIAGLDGTALDHQVLSVISALPLSPTGKEAHLSRALPH